MISELRRYVGRNKFIRKTFNKFGGTDYAIYDRTNIITGSKFIDYFTTFDGAKYKVDGHSNFMVEETRLEYDWSDIRPDDIVLDIGAHVGSFTIGAALKAKHVYAVEPIFYKELEENVKLNALSNVTILPCAIGSGLGTINLSFNKVERKDIPTCSFADLLILLRNQYNNLHTISFLKCDGEGCEWFIKPEDLNGIRRIEMEVHPGMYPTESYNPGLIPYIDHHWTTTYSEEERETYILHAHKNEVNNGFTSEDSES